MAPFIMLVGGPYPDRYVVMSAQKSTNRRWLLRLSYLILLLTAFAAGFKLGWHFVVVDGMNQLRDLDKTRKEFCQEIYGTNYLHLHGIDKEEEARLAAFDPTRGSNTLRLSYSSWGGSRVLTLRGDGTLVSETESGTRTLAVIDPDRCKVLFHKVLTSGLLNYSEEVIQMKERLDKKLKTHGTVTEVCDGSHVKISITAPEVELDKAIGIYEPEVALKNHPDIIEFRLFIDLEKEILSLVPENDPDWHRSQN